MADTGIAFREFALYMCYKVEKHLSILERIRAISQEVCKKSFKQLNAMQFEWHLRKSLIKNQIVTFQQVIFRNSLNKLHS